MNVYMQVKCNPSSLYKPEEKRKVNHHATMEIISLSAALLLSSLILLFPSATGTAVLDVDGKRIQTATNYYIHPLNRGSGLGLALGSRNNTCPFNVLRVQDSLGLPLKFFPVNPKTKIVEESMDMNVVFSASTICVQSTAWKLGGDVTTGKRYVTTGGTTGNPGAGTLSNWFRIDKYGAYYKLVFCPGVCSFCRVACGDLGVIYENGNSWLGVSDVPMAVYFKKV